MDARSFKSTEVADKNESRGFQIGRKFLIKKNAQNIYLPINDKWVPFSHLPVM
jgi:hypothetical protein